MEKKNDKKKIECNYEQDNKIPKQIIYYKDENKKVIYSTPSFIKKDNFLIKYKYQNENDIKDCLECRILNKNENKVLIDDKDWVEGINIQKSINRPDFKKVIDVIEKNNYILIFQEYDINLEDLIKKRKYLTEKEVQCYMTQLIFPLNYLYSEKRIHRNLSTSSIYLGKNMELKVGELMSSIQLKKKEEKLTEICGDPYFMAPEMLKEKEEKGYSFEVDIWSLGIIMFRLLTGQYPFNSNSYYDLTNKIKNAQLIFPSETKISPAAQDLINQILEKDPSKRPALNQIIYHDFFNREQIPKYFPASTFEKPPEDYSKDILNREVKSKDLKSLIVPHINPIAYDSINNLNEIKKNNIKDIDIYMTQYYDYFSRFGIGYELNNGFVGVFFRDKTKMVINKKETVFKYIEKNKEISSNYQKNKCPDELRNKLEILIRFKEYFSNTNSHNEKVMSFENTTETFEEKAIKEEKEDKVDNIEFIFVENVIFDEKLIFFKLSTQTQHIFFKDGIQMIMSYDVLTYINENNKKANILLKDVLKNPIKQLKVRFNYVRYIYFNWINKQIRKKQEKKEVKEKEENEMEKI